jgi:ComF family protein
MLVDWLFRPQCAACGESSPVALCRACTLSLVELGDACPRCAEPGSPSACRRCCLSPLPVEKILTPWRFGGSLAVAIRRLKFTGATHIARALAPLWAGMLGAAAHEYGAIVVPVPLHWRRRFRRGYDQTWLLARYACELVELPPPVCALRRIRAAPPQSTLPASERAANVAGAFVARRPVDGSTILLVDDVVTTGATLAAAARALHLAGAARVIGVALARAE